MKLNTKLNIILSIAFVATLSGCGNIPQKAAEPIIDTASMPQERMAEYRTNLKACKAIQERSMKVSLFDVLSSQDVKRDERLRAEKASMIVRECLKGRGFSVLY